MKKQTTIALYAAALLAGHAMSAAGAPPAIPENLRTAPLEALSLEAAATGMQIYQCSPAKDDPTRFEWTFKAPEAELFDAAGRKIGKHYAGPTWESEDGSKVVGVVKARDNGPDPTAIPWLLLEAKSTSGSGVFGRTTSIQRLQTVGGAPPREPCGEAQAGREARVAYKAMYYFYVSGGRQ
jgi:hypothetical protein